MASIKIHLIWYTNTTRHRVNQALTINSRLASLLWSSLSHHHYYLLLFPINIFLYSFLFFVLLFPMIFFLLLQSSLSLQALISEITFLNKSLIGSPTVPSQSPSSFDPQPNSFSSGNIRFDSQFKVLVCNHFMYILYYGLHLLNMLLTKTFAGCLEVWWRQIV